MVLMLMTSHFAVKKFYSVSAYKLGPQGICHRAAPAHHVAHYLLCATCSCSLCCWGLRGLRLLVTQRAREMGIRLGLGASRNGLLRLVVMQAARLIGLGGILGAGSALLLRKLLAGLLVGVTPHDAICFSLAWALMTVVAPLASAIPAAAARTDLISVLHSE